MANHVPGICMSLKFVFKLDPLIFYIIQTIFIYIYDLKLSILLLLVSLDCIISTLSCVSFSIIIIYVNILIIISEIANIWVHIPLAFSFFPFIIFMAIIKSLFCFYKLIIHFLLLVFFPRKRK